MNLRGESSQSGSPDSLPVMLVKMSQFILNANKLRLSYALDKFSWLMSVTESMYLMTGNSHMWKLSEVQEEKDSISKCPEFLLWANHVASSGKVLYLVHFATFPFFATLTQNILMSLFFFLLVERNIPDDFSHVRDLLLLLLLLFPLRRMLLENCYMLVHLPDVQ